MSKENSNHPLNNYSGKDKSKEEHITVLSIVLSFQQSRLSAERTLMAHIRTALSLFGFGFALFQFYRYLEKEVPDVSYDTLPRDFGLSLVILGMIAIVIGVIYHIRFINQISHERKVLKEKGLLPREDTFPISSMITIALLLLIIIIAAILFMIVQIKPD